jgi:hypothetical protein
MVTATKAVLGGKLVTLKFGRKGVGHMSLCRPRWPQKSQSYSLPTAGITGMYRHTWLTKCFY